MDPTPASSRGLPWFVAGWVVAFLGVFVVPWFVPMPAQLKGDSYSFGFSNKAAVLALGAALTLIAIGLLRRVDKPNGISWFHPAARLLPPFRTAAREYLLLAVASIVAVAAILAWNWYLANPYWGEATYFLCRIDLANLGFQPYRDFQYDYGPLFIYAPIALDRLSGHALGIENAYAFCVALAYPVGFVFLFSFQRLLKLPDRDRPWILLLTLLLWFVMTLGLQYTPLRYTALPFAIAVGTHPFFTRLRWRGLQWLLVSVCCFACLMISPEMGLACAIGFVAAAAVHFLAGRTRQALACLAGLGVAVALPVLFSLDYLDSVFAFGSGAYNFPFYPSVANLILVGAALHVLPRVACSVWRQPGHALAPFAAGIGAAATALLPGAMGRCDGGHIFSNGLLLFLLLFAALAQARRSLLVTWAVVFGGCFICLSQISYWSGYLPVWQDGVMKHEIYRQYPALVHQWTQAWAEAGQDSPNSARMNWHKVVPYPDISEAVSRSPTTFTAPLAGTATLDRYCKIRLGYRPNYFPTVTPDLYTPVDVARDVREIRTNYDLWIVDKNSLKHYRQGMQQGPDLAETQRTLSGLLLFPVTNSYRHPPYVPEVEVARALLEDSTLQTTDGDFLLFRPRRMEEESPPRSSF